MTAMDYIVFFWVDQDMPVQFQAVCDWCWMIEETELYPTPTEHERG